MNNEEKKPVEAASERGSAVLNDGLADTEAKGLVMLFEIDPIQPFYPTPPTKPWGINC